MTPIQMIEFFSQQVQRASRGIEIAVANKNYHLAAMNFRQKFKAFLMQGLITWRGGHDPSGFFRDAVAIVEQGLEILSQIDTAAPCFRDLPAERSVFAAILVGSKHPHIKIEQLEGDRKLDGILGNILSGYEGTSEWNASFTHFSACCRSRIAIDTYKLYGDVLMGNVEASYAEQEGERLFSARRIDGFFSETDQTEGGGEDNLVTVDYRLGALLKRFRQNSEALHVWKWG